MKKKLINIILLISIFMVTGCGITININNDRNHRIEDNKKIDHKIYKYMKVSSANGSNLLYVITSVFGETSEVSSGDTYYRPTILFEFDTNTGNAIKAKFYTFFIDYEDDEWVNQALDKYNNSSNEYKKYYTNVSKGRVNDNISYLTCDIDLSGYLFTQFIDTYLVKGQDIEKYKDEIYYSRLYNYSTTPPVEVGDNYFEESLEGIRIEWSDSIIDAY